VDKPDSRKEWFTACDVEVLRFELVPYLDPLLPWQKWLGLKLSPLLGLDFPAVFTLKVAREGCPPDSCSQLVHLLDLAQLIASSSFNTVISREFSIRSRHLFRLDHMGLHHGIEDLVQVFRVPFDGSQ